MKPLMNLREYTRLNEQMKPIEARFEKEMDQLVEASTIGAAIGSPIKFTKIKNNLKKYMKTLVQSSINDLDFEKRLQAGENDPKAKATLKAANTAKNNALKDKASAIVDRMDHLATTDGLKLVKKIGMNKSKMEAAKKVLKAASGEEAKQLKLKIDSLSKRIADDGSSLKDYEKKGGGEEEDTSQADRLEDQEPKKKKKEKTTTAADDAAAAAEPAAAKKSATTTDDEEVGDEEADVGQALVKKAKEVKTAAIAKVTGLWDTLKGKVNSLADTVAAATEPEAKEKAEADLATAKAEEVKAGEKVETVKKEEDKKVDAAKAKAEESPKAENASFKPFQAKNNSYKHIHESVRDKFARLINEKKSV